MSASDEDAGEEGLGVTEPSASRLWTGLANVAVDVCFVLTVTFFFFLTLLENGFFKSPRFREHSAHEMFQLNFMSYLLFFFFSLQIIIL